MSEDGKNWKKVTSFGVDESNPFVTFSRTNLSYFALVGSASSEWETATSATSSGGGGGGCSLGSATPASGFAGTLLSLLGAAAGLFGLRRKKKVL